jgi:hypothetical protein
VPEVNPYAPPKASVADSQEPSAADIERLNRVASGQRFMVLSVVVSIAATFLQPILGPFALVVSLAAAIVAIFSVIRLGLALGSSGVMCFLLAVLMIVPLVNLLVMARLSGRATKLLRASGYRVGLLGAKART